MEGREIFSEALLDCPCCSVAGNNDFFSDLPREEEIELDGNKVLVTHGHYYGVSMDISGVAEEAKSRDCDAVFFGHTHKPVSYTHLDVYKRQACRCELINPQVKPAPQELQDKHYYRKHGANAYYGQIKR